ncbi:orotidine-5'-phosphate decarboxylase [Buchnera aphidicola]|uniref:orotidine-5'-phosphate decarboxylase n=1 Tax=Buchnera aphidicola TaxID=9 RepID=UPI003463C6AC
MNQKNLKNIPKIIIALDFCKKHLAIDLIKKLDPEIYKVKIGYEMFIRFGVSFIEEIKKFNFDIFLDLKFHDIPSTVFKAVYSVAKLGIWMISIHGCGGYEMMISAKKALSLLKLNPPFLVAVTSLTSFNIQNLSTIGVSSSIEEYVIKISKLSQLAKLNGVICPGFMSKKIKNIFGKSFKTIIPGMRFIADDHHDHNMVMYPDQIKNCDCDYIVIGRSITQSKNPIKRLKEILKYI